ncbi:hypothetical protein ACFL2T_03295 [Elusimicrobiota bacterium]
MAAASKEYVAFLGATLLVFGVLVHSDLWRQPVKLHSLNPLVYLHLDQFPHKIAGDDIVTVASATCRVEIAEPKKDRPRYLVFFQELYSTPNNELFHGDANSKWDPDSELAAIVARWQGELGYTTVGGVNAHHRFWEHPRRSGHLVHQLMNNASLAWQVPRFFSATPVPANSSACEVDFFGRCLSTLEDSLEKVNLLVAFHNASQFFSIFAIENTGTEAAHDVTMDILIPRRTSRFVERTLRGKNPNWDPYEQHELHLDNGIVVGQRQENSVRLRIPTLLPGHEHYKLFMLKTWGAPIRKELVSLHKKGLLAEVSDHSNWLLFFPLLLVLGCRFWQWIRSITA